MIALSSHHVEEEAQDQCPWCQQPIPHALFKEIEARIKTEERKRMAAVEAELMGKFAAETAETNASWKRRLQAAKEDGAAAVEAASIAAQKQIDDFKAQEETIFATRLAEARKPLEAEKATLAATLAAEKKAREAAQTELASQKANHEAIVQTRVNETRTALEEAHAKQKAAAEAQSFKENQALRGQVEALQRKLEKKTNDELGEGGEVEVYDELRKAFPKDDIVRVKKGAEGADIVHKALEKGEVYGTIVYDSKNRNAWRNDYIVQLRKDKQAAKAEHAILATRVFPAGSNKQLVVREGVILANPARVVALVEMLRNNMIAMAKLRLSAQEREEKKASLYDFITSARCGELFAQMESVDDAMLQLDVDEKKAHDKVWERRGTLIKSHERARVTMTSEIAAIVQASKVVPMRKAQ